MPHPKKGEKKSSFIGRAISQLRHEGKPQDQAVAIAHSMWRKRKLKTMKKMAKG